MASINTLTVSGHAGRHAEYTMTKSGVGLTKFSLAVVSYKGKDKDGTQRYDTMWFTVACWGRLADIAQPLVKKGGYYIVSGSLAQNTYVGKDGVSVTRLELIASDVVLAREPKTVSETEPDEHPF